MFTIDRTDQSVIGRWWWTVDRLLLVSLLILCGSGIVLITAASPAVAERIDLPTFHFLKKHLIVLIPAVLGMIIISMMKARNIWRIGILMLIGSIFMMIVTFLFSSDIKGASRWIHIFGFSLQPSEFAKPAFAIVSAWLIAKQHENNIKSGMMIATLFYIIILALLLLQPDIGMSFVLSVVWISQIFIGGLSIMLLTLIIAIGIIGLVSAYFLFSHVKDRFDRFLNPSMGDNYQIEKSLDSFHNGGLMGVGPGEGKVKMHLPDAHADFIFAVSGEEFGLIITLGIIILYTIISVRSVSKAIESKDLFCILAVTGIIVQFGLQAIIHMGSSLQVLPAKGMTLPFISYGGSSLLSLAIAMGAVLALTRKDSHNRL